MVERTMDRSVEVEVVGRGDVSPDDVAYARRRVAVLLDLHRKPILLARVTLTKSADPANERPAMAEGELDVNGRILRAHVAAGDFAEASDLLQRRLRDRLGHHVGKGRARRYDSGEASPGEWRHGDRPTVRPRWFDRPLDERRLVRTKTFAIDELTLEEAAFDLESLDHDFLLYADATTGEDAVIERADGGYRVLPVASAPVLTTADAVERLGASGERWLFYADAESGAGHVLYQRFDGHYGLVTPAST